LLFLPFYPKIAHMEHMENGWKLETTFWFLGTKVPVKLLDGKSESGWVVAACDLKDPSCCEKGVNLRAEDPLLCCAVSLINGCPQVRPTALGNPLGLSEKNFAFCGRRGLGADLRCRGEDEVSGLT